jgi:hypothetical protein
MESKDGKQTRNYRSPASVNAKDTDKTAVRFLFRDTDHLAQNTPPKHQLISNKNGQKIISPKPFFTQTQPS